MADVLVHHLGANKRLGNAKSSMLQENNPEAACLYVHSSSDVYERESTTQYGRAGHGTAQRCTALHCAATLS